MAPILTPEQLAAKLSNLSAKSIPAIEKEMANACLNVVGLSKEYCTPGKSPYYKAPYSDDNDPRRKPPHMRDVIDYEVKTEGKSVRGIIKNPKDYALAVHDGTSKMQGRAFILDPIKAKSSETVEILSDALIRSLREECV